MGVQGLKEGQGQGLKEGQGVQGLKGRIEKIKKVG